MELSHLSACIRMSLDTLSHAVSVLSFWQKTDWNCQRLYDILPVSGAPVLFCLQRCTERLGGVSPHQSCANTFICNPNYQWLHTPATSSLEHSHTTMFTIATVSNPSSPLLLSSLSFATPCPCIFHCEVSINLPSLYSCLVVCF